MFFILSWFFLLGCCSIPSDIKIKDRAEADLKLIPQLEYSTVALLAPNNKNNFEILCGGVFIAKDLIITARHCTESYIPEKQEEIKIDSSKELTVEDLIKIINYINEEPNLEEMIDKEVYFKTFDDLNKNYNKENLPEKTAKIIAFDQDNDLALLKSNNFKSDNFVNISQSNGLIGNKVHIIGHPAKVEFTYFTGIISGFRTNPNKGYMQNLLHITAPIYMGNSGGGAFDESGNLIGICSFFRPAVPNMSFFVDANTINNFINSQLN